MMEKNAESYAAITYVWIFFVAMLGGIVSFMKKVKEGQQWRLVDFLIELTTAAFAGIITAYLCQWAGVPFQGTVALAGIAGHMGTKLITLAELVVANQITSTLAKSEKDKP
jgi:hypothetical protein